MTLNELDTRNNQITGFEPGFCVELNDGTDYNHYYVIGGNQLSCERVKENAPCFADHSTPFGVVCEEKGKDWEALSEFYQSLGGANWNDNTGWMKGDYCQ